MIPKIREICWVLPPLVEAQRGLDEALESGSASGPLALDHSTFSAACSFTQRMICQAPGTALALGIQQ